MRVELALLNPLRTVPGVWAGLNVRRGGDQFFWSAPERALVARAKKGGGRDRTGGESVNPHRSVSILDLIF